MTLVAPAGGTSALASRVADVVRTHAAGSQRSIQRAIGPSQIGNPCDRALAYASLDMPMPRSTSDPWAAVVGTATHAWLAEAFTAANERLGRLRYLVETKVKVTDSVWGTADLYDLDTNEVIDHKVLGVDSLRKIRAGDIPEKYRVQIHLYGYGLAGAGMPVEKVSIVAYPRSGFLDGIATFTEDYRPDVAWGALDRLSRISAAALVLELDEYPERWELMPATPSSECKWCPHWRPGLPVDGQGCPGQEIT